MALLHEDKKEFEGRLPKGDRLTFQLKSSPKMFQMLSDGIYTDKVMAVIRELSCNAYDSVAMAKIANPAGEYFFTLNVPTKLDSNFWVEDVGLGIDPEKIVEIFWTYGASTKTDTNDAIGALGLGSKSPFAYTKSSFLVINRYNGVEYKYFCFINEDGVPDGKLVYQSATDKPNGVRVELAVRTEDISTFRARIVRFYSCWNESKLPVFSGDTSIKGLILAKRKGIVVKGTNWELRSGDYDLGDDPYAVMGGVPYRINTTALPEHTSDRVLNVLSQPLNITFPIGALSFQVSREELSYDEPTIKAVIEAAEQVAKELIVNSRKALQDIATPYDFSVKFERQHAELYRTYKFIANELGREHFKLTDGRKINGMELRNKHARVTSTGHLPYTVSEVVSEYRSYVKGTQHYGLAQKVTLTLVQKGKLDPKTNKIGSDTTNYIDWFAPGLAPKPWINQNRQRTPANYLADGFTVTSSDLRLTIKPGGTTAFIINDIGERGAEGMKFYKGGFTPELLTAFNEGCLYFVNGFPGSKTVAELEEEIKLFTKNTAADGAPIFLLSKLPDFKLPEAPKKPVNTAPKAVPQRGMIEQRFRTYTFSRNPDDTYVTAANGRYGTSGTAELSFASCSQVTTAYERVPVTRPMLYIDTNWGQPVSDSVKELASKEAVAALVHLGLLNDFVSHAPANPAGWRFSNVSIAMLSPAQVQECERKGVPLTNLTSFVAAVRQRAATATEMIKLIKSQTRANDDVWTTNVVNRCINNNNFIKYVLPKLHPTNILVQLATSSKVTAAFFKKNMEASALMFLIGTVSAYFDAERKDLVGEMRMGQVLKTYALIEGLYDDLPGKSTKFFDQLALYINTVDAQRDQELLDEKLKEQERLHAESLLALAA